MAVFDIPTDPCLVARNQQRADEMKQRMGQKYLLHPTNRVQRLKSHVNLAQIGSVVTKPKGGVR